MAEERKTTTVNTLVATIDNFIIDNVHSNYVEMRWLSAWMREPLRVARQVRADNLDDDLKAQVATFRLQEIETQKERHQRDIEALDMEAAKLKVA